MNCRIIMKATLSALMTFVVFCLFSCNRESIVADDTHSYANSPKALEYCREHKGVLLKDIFSKMAKDENSSDPVVNNPDITREVLIPIGYNGLNVAGFLEAGAYLDSIVVDSLIKKAVAMNNRTALLISGNSSSGKSTAMKRLPYLEALRKSVGFSSDQTFENFATLTRMIEQLKGNGFEDEDITIAMVYCDAPTSFFSACGRLYRTGRAISKAYFADIMYPLFIGRVELLYTTYGEVHPLILLDNAKYELDAITDENGVTVGYSGADNSRINEWVYYNTLAAGSFINIKKGVKEITSVEDLPKSLPATDTTAAHWHYDLSDADKVEIVKMAEIWARGGDAPYKYSQECLPWFGWDFDFYVPQYSINAGFDKPDATNIDWNLYPTDGTASPFYYVRNPETAKNSMLENLLE